MLNRQHNTSSNILYFRQNKHQDDLANNTNIDYNEDETLSSSFDGKSLSIYPIQLQVMEQMLLANKQTASTTEGGYQMDWQEKYIDKLDHEISEMKESLRATEERIANMIGQSLDEMRDRDNQRHQEFLELRKEINAIRTDNLETRRWIIGMVLSAIGVSVAAIIGIVSIVIR